MVDSCSKEDTTSFSFLKMNKNIPRREIPSARVILQSVFLRDFSHGSQVFQRGHYFILVS
jgi:hypothetical protein